MNNINGVFDHLIKKNKCFHLSHIGYTLVEAGASRPSKGHAEQVADLALALQEACKRAIKCLVDPKDQVKIAVRGMAFGILNIQTFA